MSGSKLKTKLNKSRTKTGIFLSIPLTIGLAIFIYFYFFSQAAGAVWLDDNWRYRTFLTITHNAEVTNNKVKFDIDTATLIAAGKMQSDCGDSRFTNINGNLLNYYIDTANGACNTASTDYYVLIPTVFNGTTIVYHYYGNPSAIDGTQANQFTEATLTPSGGYAAGSEEQTPGPIAYWKFDEGYGTTARSSNSSSSNATITGATWQAEDLCVSGKCLYFDGTNDDVTDTNTVDSVKTVTFWVRPNTFTATTSLVQLTASAYITADSSGVISATGFTSPTIYVNGTVFSSLIANTWQYVTVTTGTAINANSIVFGKQAANYLKGFMDEIKFYSQARSAAQIKTDYVSRSSAEGVSAQMGGADQKYLSEGLVGYWKTDESSGNAADSSGNGLTLTNNSIMAYGAGKFGNAATCDGTADYLNTATSISGVKTVSFWAYPAAAANNYFINLINSSAYITIDSSGVVSATGFTSPSIYVNNTLNGTVTATAWNLITVTTNTGINANAFAVGLTNDGVNNFCTNTSKIDEVRTYNRALSAKEVSDLYNWAPGPVGYWRLDDKVSGDSKTVVDVSGNGNNGTTNDGANNIGMDCTKPGKYGAACQFDGTDDYVSTANTFNVKGGFTAGAWIKTSYTDNTTYFMGNKGGAASTGFNLRVTQTSGVLSFSIKDDNGNGCTAVSGNTNVADGAWHYVVLTGDSSSGNGLLYVDGKLDKTKACGLNTSITGNNNLVIGFDTGQGSAAYFNGLIDEARVYNYVKTQKQIVSDMNAGHPAVGSPVGSAVGYWKFDEGYNTTANDSTFNNNDLTLAFAAWTNSGKFGKAWNATGTSWMSRADDSDFDVTSTDSYTVSLWFKTDSANNPGAVEYLFNKASATVQGYAIYANTDGTFCFGIDDDTTWNPDVTSCTATDVYDATWHHLIAVRDVTTDKTLIYIDGVLKDSDTDSTTDILANSLSLYIGDRDGTDNGDEFSGDLDEIKVYRYALTADEVKTEYNRGSSLVLGAAGDNSTYQPQAANQEYCIPGDSTSCAAPVGEWDFEEGTGTSAYDTSGNGFTGTITSAVWQPGKIGSSLYFDGTNDDVSMGNQSTLNFADGQDFTITFWVKVSDFTTDQVLVGKKTSLGSSTAGYAVYFDNPVDRIYFDIADGVDEYVVVSNAIPTIGWIHVAAVFDDDSTANTRVYINGVDDTPGTSGILADIGSLSNSVAFKIAGQGNGALDFNGSIDEVKVYNYARTPAQIAWDYNRGRPVGWWKMDECQGTTANDSSGKGNTGTLTVGGTGTQTAAGTCSTSGTAWGNGATGKRNYSLKLDGTDDYISVTDTANLRFNNSTDDFSLFAWVKRTTTGEEYIVSKEDADNDGYRLLFTSSNTVQCSEDVTDVTSASTITDTNWHLIGCTIDRDGNGQVYIDGRADGSTSAMGTDAMATTANITIGTRSYTATSYLNGQVDDVRIYNYSLTGTQIKNLYNNGAVNFSPVTGSP